MQQVQHFNTEITLGALAANDTIIANTPLDGSREQGFRIKQLKATCTFKNKTGGEGPIGVGFAKDLTNAEVEEALEADPQDQHDVPAVEQGNRRVFPIWTIGEAETGIGQPVYHLREVRFPWKEFLEGEGLQVFAHNWDDTVLTTGTRVHITVVVVYEWLKD